MLKWDLFWNPLLDLSGHLLGLSWEGLGPLLGALGPPKWGPRGWRTLGLGCLLSHLASFVVFFVFGAPPGAFSEGFGPILVPSGPILGRFFGIFGRLFGMLSGLWGPQWIDNWTNKKWYQSSLNSPARRNARSDWINYKFEIKFNSKN